MVSGEPERSAALVFTGSPIPSPGGEGAGGEVEGGEKQEARSEKGTNADVYVEF